MLNKSSDQMLEKAIAVVTSIGTPEGTASNRPISHEFKSSDLSSYEELLEKAKVGGGFSGILYNIKL